MKKNIYSFILMLFFGLSAFAQPTVLPALPTAHAASDVISVYNSSATYTNVGGTDFFPNWGQGTVVSDFAIGASNVKKYDMLDYEGTQFASNINASSMTNLHVDMWTTNCNTFQFFLINTTTTAEQQVTLTPSHAGWNSFDIALNQYSASIVSNIGQFKFVDIPMNYHTSTTVVYLDNIYFWKPANTPTLSAFSVPAQVLGAVPFTLTAPTSNSSGAFTYTSGNTAVATISGSIVTVVGVGNAVITANQAAAGGYATGSITAQLVVSYPAPMVAAQNPTAANTDVISVYSNTYTEVAGTDFFPNWGQSTVVSEISIGSNTIKKMDNFNYEGTQFATPIDASAMQNLHIDIWTPNCTAFDFYLINAGPIEQKVTLTPNNIGWNSFDIPLSQFNTINLASIIQFKYVSTPFGGTTVYYDNVYFWKVANPPTLSNFAVPTKVLGAAPFTITAPTSNSPGAFTYTSGNTNVATISGSTITIVGAGTSTITALQAAAGGYGVGSIAASFVVTVGPIMTAAPVPTALPANVLSLFSDTYTPTTIGIDWFPNWGQSTVVADTIIVGNTTKKYSTTNYQGVQFASPLDVSTYDKLHLDVWSPNCSSFKFYLINTSPVVEQSVTLTPILGGWNSYDIVLASSFRGAGTLSVVNLASVNQMKIDAIPSGTTTLYFDNIYFYKAAPLPITLVNFTATKNKNLVTLNWSTLSELNNKGFEIEKSIDGINYNSIGFVNGNANSVSKINYASVDTKPAMGANYYRLKQIDVNGRFSNSTIQVVKFAKSDLLNFSFFPNPAKDVLKITIGLVDNDNANIKLMNVLGQTIISQNVNKSSTAATINFNISALKAGIYFIELNDGINKSIEKVVIN